jgi:hypothetical protein
MFFRTALRLCGCNSRVTIRRPSPLRFAAGPQTVHTAVHRFEETIGGRAYQIEVAPIDTDRWRAYIVRVPGVPTALMPFYGVTPDEAAGNLRQWLTRAHSRVAISNGNKGKPPA